MRNLPRYKNCFVCGHKNPSGLNMIWQATPEGAIGEYTTEERFCGYDGITHGGIISSLLDECLGWAVGLAEKKMFYTGELKVVFNVPLPIGKKVLIKGYCSKDQDPDKKYKIGTGEIVDDEGIVYATARGKFFAIPNKMDQAILDSLELPGKDQTGVTLEELWGTR